MEAETQKRLDNMLEDEVRLGYRVKDVPKHFQELLTANSGPALGRVRFTRLNPSRRRKIAEVVQRQYHKDLRDSDILSHEQILKLVEERGEWTPAMDKELKALQESTNKEMGELYASGLMDGEWGRELLDLTGAFKDKLGDLVTDAEELKKILRILDRWSEYSVERQAEYDTRYAESQGLASYSADSDMKRLLAAVVNDMEWVDTLYKIDDLKDRLYRFMRLQRDRAKLADMQLKYIKIFSESVEQRRDNTDEMARLYFTTERVDEQGTPLGPLTSTFDALWDWPEEVVQWLLLEAYFFQNGVPDAAREYLESFGFLKADPAIETNPSPSGESAPSDGLPDPQTSSSAIEPAVATDAGSLVPAALMT